MTLKTTLEVASYLHDEIVKHRKKEISFFSPLMKFNTSDIYREILNQTPALLLCIDCIAFRLACTGLQSAYTVTVTYHDVYPSFVRFVDTEYQVRKVLQESTLAHRKNEYLICRASDLDRVLSAVNSIVNLPEYLNAYITGVQPSVLRRPESDYIGIVVRLTYDCDYRTAKERMRLADKEIKRIATLARAAGSEDWKKAYTVLSFCVENWEYDRISDSSLKFSSYSALVHKKAVCMGFSLALCAIFKELGIPSKYIYGTKNGEGHAWNMVYIRGGWFYIDVTDAIGMKDPLYNWGVTHFDDGRTITTEHEQPLACHCNKAFLSRYINRR